MKRILFLFLVSILLVQSVSAFTFLNIYIDKSGEATFVGETTDFPEFPEGIKIQGSKVIGKTPSLTSKSGPTWYFNYTLQGSEINLILPKGAVIKSLSNGEISIDNEQISIFFTNQVSITYTIKQSFSESLGFSSNSTLLGIIFIAILFVLIVFLINFSKREKEEEKIISDLSEKIDKIKIISKILSKREKEILSSLKESGKIKQSYLRKLTEIPKASFSRHIQELEKKKLIKRTGEGKNKFVELVG